MLSQRMAAAACLSFINVSNETQIAIGEAAYEDFQTALVELASGSAAREWPRETNAEILEAIEIVKEEWALSGPSFVQMMQKDYVSFVVNQMLTGNLALLSKSNDVVQTMVRAYMGDTATSPLGKTIDIAGRQRMLTQRMLKETCLIAAGFLQEKNVELLTGSIELFDTSLRHLRDGHHALNVVAPPSQAIADQLDVVTEHWAEYSAMLRQTDKDMGIDPEFLATLAVKANETLAASHQVVLMYASLSAANESG